MEGRIPFQVSISALRIIYTQGCGLGRASRSLCRAGRISLVCVRHWFGETCIVGICILQVHKEQEVTLPNTVN